MHVFGPELAEVPLLTTRAELQGNGLGPLLLHNLEAALLQAGVGKVIMPALPLPELPLMEALPPTGRNACPLWQLAAARAALSLFSFCKQPLQIPSLV